MSVVPGGIDPEAGPPTRLPLVHFLAGLAFLVAAAAVGVAASLAAGPWVEVAAVHLLVVGWVCVTIMGAMTQFVPVWSGVELHSRRLASVQLPLVVGGVLVLTAGLLTARLAWLPVGGALLTLGLWTFCVNLAGTLAATRPLDVTERHFALSLAFFAVVPALGLALGWGLARPDAPVPYARVADAHATLAVFGAVLTTVAGALYQLATMFTATDLDRLDRRLQRVETLVYPAGVVVLAAGRLLGRPGVARAGGLLVVAGLLALAVVLCRRLVAAQVERTPMLSRYAVVAGAILAWAALTLPTWLRAPLAARFGGSAARPLLLVGVVGVVVLGTLYHVVPFLVWVDAYSDRLGLADVPTVEDLYDDRLAAADFWLVLAGVAGLVAVGAGAPAWLATVGWGLVAAGAVAVAANLLLVVHRHGDGCPPVRVLRRVRDTRRGPE